MCRCFWRVVRAHGIRFGGRRRKLGQPAARPSHVPRDADGAGSGDGIGSQPAGDARVLWQEQPAVPSKYLGTAAARRRRPPFLFPMVHLRFRDARPGRHAASRRRAVPHRAPSRRLARWVPPLGGRVRASARRRVPAAAEGRNERLDITVQPALSLSSRSRRLPTLIRLQCQSLHVAPAARSKCPPWQHGASARLLRLLNARLGGPGRLGTPRARPRPLSALPPPRMLERATSEVTASAAL